MRLKKLILEVVNNQLKDNDPPVTKKHMRNCLAQGILQAGKRENDPYLYREKVRAYLRRGERQVPGYEKLTREIFSHVVLR